MKSFLSRFLFVCLLLMAGSNVQAQRVALRTNTLDWAMLTPNLTLEARLSSHLSLCVGMAGNPVKFDIAGFRYNTYRVWPELRYWFSRPMARHFVGVAVMGSWYDLLYKQKVYSGDMLTMGASYGYALVLNRHWNVEFSGGVGFGFTHGYKYPHGDMRPSEINIRRWVVIPMNVAVSFSYIFN